MIRCISKYNLVRLEDYVRRPARIFTFVVQSIENPDQCSDAVYKIMTAKGLQRTDRLNLLKLMKEYDKLTLRPCGPEKLSPPLYTMLLKRTYLMRYFIDLPGIAQRKY